MKSIASLLLLLHPVFCRQWSERHTHRIWRFTISHYPGGQAR